MLSRDMTVAGGQSIDGSPDEEVHLIRHDIDPAPTRSLISITAYFMMIHFLLAFCEMVLVAPLIELFEKSICLTYYNFPSGGVEEGQCKVDAIQVPLATVRGWKSMFDTIPGAFLSFPKRRFMCS